LVLIFIIVICFFLIIWSSFFWLLLILFEIIYEMVIIIILISSSFIFFLDLISIILIIIYFIWDNLWNFFFNFILIQLFNLFIPHYFNKLEKNKTLISYFSAHFPWHNQTLEIVFQLIFHYTTKHRKIIHFLEIHFPGIHFPKKITFQQINRANTHN